MLRHLSFVRAGLQSTFTRAGLASVLAIGLTAAAEARRAAIVVDANTGRVLHESQADAPRFPASLTKVMTLYMIFEQLDAGRISLNTRFDVSARAAAQQPSKLWLEEGSTIRVEDVILGLVTRSANDAAVVAAENIGGSVEVFAQRMTARARQIGMSRTTFRNPSGLPDPQQTTTARDLSVLGRAIYERFPQYAHYFTRRNFVFEGESIRNHNRLLGRIEGVDGIKTGYTRASGFNLLTSARVDGRHVVAVVLGGNSGRQRDAQMASLVQRNIAVASRHRQPDREFAQRLRQPAAPITTAARVETPAPQPTPQPARAPEVARAPAPAVATQAPVALAPPAPAAPPAAQTAQREIVPLPNAVRTASVQSVGVPAMRWHVGPRGAGQAVETVQVPATTASTARPAAAPAAPPVPQPALSGWVIQIAAASNEMEARRMLSEARGAAGRPLAQAQPVTEAVNRGGSTLVRARFAGFSDRRSADAACAALIRQDFDCMAIRL